LLISAQSTAHGAAALFGAVALDLARAGVFHVKGGVGGIAETLAARVRELGGRVIYKAEVTHIQVENGKVTRVSTRKKGEFPADRVVANLTPWNIATLLGDSAPPSLRNTIRHLPPQWGAFTLYLGVDAAAVPADFPDHHQLLQEPSQPLGEGNTLFMSLSPTWDASRAPDGQRTMTLSTHTRPEPWWELRNKTGGQGAYDDRVEAYSKRLLAGAEQILPGVRRHIRLQLPGTPVTFQTFTRRHLGFVGGFPQQSILTANSPRLPVKGLWMVGDSIFPGQSTAGVTLGALRVADTILREGTEPHRVVSPASVQPLPPQP
jgi:phytoene dehydrogenase-like protein